MSDDGKMLKVHERNAKMPDLRGCPTAICPEVFDLWSGAARRTYPSGFDADAGRKT
jgi:hypothetical protein